MAFRCMLTATGQARRCESSARRRARDDLFLVKREDEHICAVLDLLIFCVPGEGEVVGCGRRFLIASEGGLDVCGEYGRRVHGVVIQRIQALWSKVWCVPVCVTEGDRTREH